MRCARVDVPSSFVEASRVIAATVATFALLVVPADVFAQVNMVSLRKYTLHVQTSASEVALRSRGPYGFLAAVDGVNIEGIAPPTLSGPINFAVLGARHNAGVMVYNVADASWRWGSDGSDYRTSSRSELDSVFGNGTYIVTVNGASIPVDLTGDAYPVAPVMTLTGGNWTGDGYVIDPARALTITTNAFAGYGTHVNDVICLFLRGPGYDVPGGSLTSCPLYLQRASDEPSRNFVSVTIPANTFVANGEYTLVTSYNAITYSRAHADLPGSSNNGRYVSSTSLSIKAITPVFPMTVTSSITSATANATAAIQFRPQDVGTTGSIYTFAVAPFNLVKGGLDPKAMRVGVAWSARKADPPDCVLAQLDSSGQLIAVTAAQLQAARSGTLSAQGASVTILNNASTPAVAGATFYVGYGASSTAMLANGVYRSAVTVPGGSVCPMLSSQTALWWNPTESGWGLNLNHQGNILFATLFTYDANRVPLWLFMSNGAMQSDGATFTGELYRATGPAFNASPFTPIGPSNLTRVGTMTVSFVDVNSGTLRYTVNDVEVNKAILRQVYGTRAAACFPSTETRAAATNYQDLWWNAPAESESGWGINITHQDNILFATLFTYDATGRDLWLVMSKGERQTDGSYLGILYRASGPPFNADPFTPITPERDLTNVGTMRLRFSDGNNGTLTYTYNGTTVTKAITRQVFSSPAPACN